MDVKKVLLIVFATVAVGCSPNVGPGEATESSSSQDRPPSTPAESVVYQLPGDTDLEILHEGKVKEEDDSYLLVIGNPETTERLMITVLPGITSDLVWPKQAQEWEAGFLDHMSRKLLSEPVDFNGHEAYHTVAEAGDEDNLLRIDAYFFIAGPWSYTVILSRPSSTEQAYEELVSVRDSIQIR